MAKYAGRQIKDDLYKLKQHAMKLVVVGDDVKPDVRHIGPGESEAGIMMTPDAENFLLTVYNSITNIEKALEMYENTI